MTDQPLFQLRKPLELVDIVRNDMGEPASYLFRRTDGSEHELVSCGEDYVQRVFVPVDEVEVTRQLETQTKKIRGEITKVINKAFQLGLARYEPSSGDGKLIGLSEEAVARIRAITQGETQ